MTHAGPFRNTILQSLDPASIDRLQLRAVTLEIRHPIETPGVSVSHIFFIETGIVSVTTRFQDGSEVEAGMFGYESLSGFSAFMSPGKSLNGAYMQISGHGYVSKSAHAAAEFKLAGRFHDLALLAFHAQFLQSMQNAGCNATHDIEQRLSRWLLLCADRMESNTLALSHEFISDMLGTRRSTVTVAAGHLKKLGLIQYSRGSIRILDRGGLEDRACECYCVLRDYLRDLPGKNKVLSVSLASSV